MKTKPDKWERRVHFEPPREVAVMSIDGTWRAEAVLFERRLGTADGIVCEAVRVESAVYEVLVRGAVQLIGAGFHVVVGNSG